GRSRDARDQDLRPAVGLAELDLHAPQLDRADRRAHPVRPPRAPELQLEQNMTAVITDDKIPNNVNLAGDRRLQRALEAWQPRFIEWWMQMGPDGFQAKDIYLRTAVSVETD